MGCGSWIRGGRRAGGLRRLGVGCRGLDGGLAGGLRGSSLHSQGSSGGGCSFRALREGWWCSLPMLVPARSADARSVLGRGSGANGCGVGLRWFGGWFVGAWGRIIVVEQIRGVWLWVVVGWTMSRRVGFADRACTRRETQGRIGLSRCARGVVVFASYARSGSIR